ncbi:MAG: cytochrome c [bacterium]|nr:cytochrome c [bacterium]
MQKGVVAAAALAAGFGTLLYVTGSLGPKAPPAPARSPAASAPAPAVSMAAGKALYAVSCLECHGEKGAGNDKGPPLVHLYYAPGHHSDQAFTLAVRRGARQHHWRFGDMEPIPGLSDAEIALIARYVRGLQRQAGIF